ncbi:transporter [Undibacterium sp. LX40W]|uniref:Transporter n=2 Tax=Oxalobacteraceae TaxID=75682 RepID=A0A923KUL7_9BURK|nr:MULTISPECIES: transporter [Undibacterium]MBC3883426.1 transporter [Undibacterium nitidum]MBC3893708.1 transporter [Undibacterium sp. LX40W]
MFMDAQQLSYGADLSGLICGYLFENQQAGRPLQTNEVIDWLKTDTRKPEGAFLWLHFNLAHSATEKWLHDHTDSPEEFFESLHQGSRSTRIEHADQHLIAVINDVLHDFSFDPSEIATLWLNLNSRLMISARRKPLKSVDHLRNAVNRGEIFHSPAELLTHLLRDQADVLTGIVRDATTKIDDVEDHFLSERMGRKRANLGELRRLLVRLQRLLAPEPAALFRLLQKPPVWMAENDVHELRQSTEEFSVVLSDMASLQERIKLLQEEIAAHVGEQNNRSLFLLTIVTVLALPINIIAGLMGMNVGGIPLAQDEHGFWIVVAIVVSFTILAVLFVYRRGDKD